MNNGTMLLCDRIWHLFRLRGGTFHNFFLYVQGHYGVVKEGMLFASQDDRSNPQKIAAKELKGDFQNVIDSEEFKEEAVLMSKLEHDNVVKFLGISDNSTQKINTGTVLKNTYNYQLELFRY